jgi:type I restriction-modification system DNA methylase subunit
LTFDCVIANPPFSLKEDWTLSIYRYVLPPIGEDIPPLPEAVEAFKTALAEARAAEDRLRTVLTEGGWLDTFRPRKGSRP